MAAGRTPVDQLMPYDVGDGLRAADVNAFIAAAKRQDRIFGNGCSGDAETFAFSNLKNTTKNLVRVVNQTGAEIPRGGIVEINDQVGFDVYPVNYTVIKVSSTYQWRYLVADQVIPWTSGPNYSSGWASFLYDMPGAVLIEPGTGPPSSSAPFEWGPTYGQFYAQPYAPGFIWHGAVIEAGVDDYIYAKQSTPRTLNGVNTSGGSISQGGVGICSVYGGSGGVTSLTYSLSSCINLGDSIPASDPVFLELICGLPYCRLAKVKHT
jgi:hypothetical protein